MSTAVSVASMEAFVAVQGSGKSDSQVRLILGALAGEALTAQEVARRVPALSNQTVTRRRRLLLDAGLVEELPRRVCRVTGFKAKPLRITNGGLNVAAGAAVPVPVKRGNPEAKIVAWARVMEMAEFKSGDWWKATHEIHAAVREARA